MPDKAWLFVVKYMDVTRLTIEELIEKLSDLNMWYGRIIMNALVERGKRNQDVVIELIVALDHIDPNVRKGAVLALGRIGNGHALFPLLQCLYEIKHTPYLSAVAFALGNIGDVRAVEPLLLLLSNEKDIVRQTSARALGNLGDMRAIQPICVLLLDHSYKVRVYATLALGELGDRSALGSLVQTLRDPDYCVRRAVAWALGQLNTVEAVLPLTEALTDRDSAVRGFAAEALGKLGDARALPVLDLVQQHDDVEYDDWTKKPSKRTFVKDAAAEAIAAIKGKATEE